MNLHKHLLIASIILFGTGLALAAPFGISWIEQLQAVNAAPAQIAPTAKVAVQKSPEITEGIPRHIIVSSLGIDVDVTDGYYDAHTGQWTLSEDSAFYATPTSPITSGSGNTLIYGHNSQKIFGKLLGIKPSSEAVVTTDTGYAFTYRYVSTEAVKPTDTHSIAPASTSQLTLQTCSGAWNQTRQMFYFELESFKKV